VPTAWPLCLRFGIQPDALRQDDYNLETYEILLIVYQVAITVR
jgi:hypothetical protein